MPFTFLIIWQFLIDLIQEELIPPPVPDFWLLTSRRSWLLPSVRPRTSPSLCHQPEPELSPPGPLSLTHTHTHHIISHYIHSTDDYWSVICVFSLGKVSMWRYLVISLWCWIVWNSLIHEELQRRFILCSVIKVKDIQTLFRYQVISAGPHSVLRH